MKEYYIWAAGLFDGEGSIFVNADRLLVISLTMTDKATVHRFKQIFEDRGTIYAVLGEAPRRDTWSFRAYGEDLELIVRAMKPYLFTKAQQADLALEWRERCVGNFDSQHPVTADVRMLRDMFYEEFKELNKRGK